MEEKLGPHVKGVGPLADDEIQEISGRRLASRGIGLRSLGQVRIDNEERDVKVQPNKVDQEVAVASGRQL